MAMGHNHWQQQSVNQDQDGVFSISLYFCAAFPSSLNFGRWVPVTNSLMDEMERGINSPLQNLSLSPCWSSFPTKSFVALESREGFE